MANSSVETLNRRGVPLWLENAHRVQGEAKASVRDTGKPDPLRPDGVVSAGLIRLADIVISLCLLVFLLPVLIILAVCVRLSDGGPVFYAQSRLGFGGKGFKCYKFRSMRVNSAQLLADYLREDASVRLEWEREHKLKNDPRVTRLGHIIRKTSLDELPQLWNVLKGDMSLVGPRPIVSEEVVKYGRSFTAYGSVMPGITGLWQVMGRNDVCYNRRVAMDRLFARRRSFKLYVFILCATVPAVLLQKGSY